MTAIEWIYIHLLVIGTAVLVCLWVRGQLLGVVDQMNDRLTKINERFTAQTRVNLIFADKLGELTQKAGKVLPMRPPGPGGQ